MKYVYLEVILSRPKAYSKVTIQHNHLNGKNIKQNQKYKCKKNIKLIYLTFVHCTLYTIHCTLYTVHYTLYTVHYTLYTVHVNLRGINNFSLVKTMNKLFLINSTNSLKRKKSINSLSLVKTIIELFTVKAYKIVICSICVRCIILILFIKTVRCSILHHIYIYVYIYIS